MARQYHGQHPGQMHWMPSGSGGVNARPARAPHVQAPQADDTNIRLLNKFADLGNQIGKALGDMHVRDETAKVDDALLSAKREFEEWRSGYERENQGRLALNAQSDFINKWDEITRKYRENWQGPGNEIFGRALNRRLYEEGLYAASNGRRYETRQRENWQKSQMAALHDDFNRYVLEHPEDTAGIELKKSNLFARMGINKPGVDQRSEFNKIDESVYFSRIEAMLASGDIEGAERLASRPPRLAGNAAWQSTTIDGPVEIQGKASDLNRLDPEYRKWIAEKAGKYGVPESLALGLAMAESGGNPRDLSARGAYGLMQIMPELAKQYGLNRNDPEQNIEAGLRYLKEGFDKFGNWGDAIIAYNMGHGGFSDYKAGRRGLPDESARHRARVKGWQQIIEQAGLAGDGSASQNDQSVAAMTKAAIQSGTAYQMGARGKDKIDCSGWTGKTAKAFMDEANREAGARLFDDKAKNIVAEGLKQNGAAGIIEAVGRATGKFLDAGEILANPRPGMLIGISRGEHAKGRFNDIGHIGQLFSRDGEIHVTESRSEKDRNGNQTGGVRETGLKEFLARYRPEEITGVDLNLLASQNPVPMREYGGVDPLKLEAVRRRIDLQKRQAGAARSAEAKLAIESALDAQLNGEIVEREFSPQDFINAFGKEGAAEAQQKYQLARDFSYDSQALATMTPKEQDSLLAMRRPKSDDLHHAQKLRLYQALANRKAEIGQARQKDPAGYAMQVNPVLARAAQNMLVSAFEPADVSGYLKALETSSATYQLPMADLLSADMAKAAAAIFDQTDNPQAMLQNITKGAGPYARQMMSQIAGKAAQNVVAMSAMNDREAVSLLRQAIRYNDFLSQADAKIRSRPGAITSDQINGALMASLAPMLESLNASGSLEMANAMFQNGQYLARQYMLRNPGMTVEQAAQKAADAACNDRYEFINRYAPDDRLVQTVRIPSQLPAEEIRAGMEALLRDFPLDEIYIELPQGVGKDAQQKIQKSDLAANGYFTNNRDESGLSLRYGNCVVIAKPKGDKGMRRYELSFEELAELGREAQARLGNGEPDQVRGGWY